MKVFVKENTWLKRDLMGFKMDFGWGNGYVLIPKDHPLHGVHYNEIHNLIPHLQVNGGLTFSEYADGLNWVELPENSEGCWVVGFDTAHSWDTSKKWPDSTSVLFEAESLRDQLEKYK